MAEKCIELDSVEIAAAVFGNCDRNIRLLEKSFQSPLSAAVHSCAFPASLPTWPLRTEPWRECCF